MHIYVLPGLNIAVGRYTGRFRLISDLHFLPSGPRSHSRRMLPSPSSSHSHASRAGIYAGLPQRQSSNPSTRRIGVISDGQQSNFWAFSGECATKHIFDQREHEERSLLDDIEALRRSEAKRIRFYSTTSALVERYSASVALPFT